MEPTIRKLTMDEPAVFRICTQSALDDSWMDYFGLRAISVEVDEAGIAATFLTTEPVDQAGLVGLVNRLNALALPLVNIEILQVIRRKKALPAPPPPPRYGHTGSCPRTLGFIFCALENVRGIMNR